METENTENGRRPLERSVSLQLADLDDVVCGHPAALRELKNLRDELKLATHKIITCGVAASHPDADLSRRGAYAKEWDSPQAEQVRRLRVERDQAMDILRRIASRKRRTQEQRLASSCVEFLDNLKMQANARS